MGLVEWDALPRDLLGGATLDVYAMWGDGVVVEVVFPQARFRGLINGGLPFLRVAMNVRGSSELPFHFFQGCLLPCLLTVFLCRAIYHTCGNLNEAVILLRFGGLNSLVRLDGFRCVIGVDPSRKVGALYVVPRCTCALVFLNGLGRGTILHGVDVLVLVRRRVARLLHVLATSFKVVTRWRVDVGRRVVGVRHVTLTAAFPVSSMGVANDKCFNVRVVLVGLYIQGVYVKGGRVIFHVTSAHLCRPQFVNFVVRLRFFCGELSRALQV